MVELSYDLLNNIAKKHGDTFYLLDSKKFEDNYKEMLASFRKYYSNTYIAYSYKTNYTPKLCRIINENGGCAEIVSEMEMWLALRLGVEPENIYYNGPYKKEKDIERLMLMGGHINCDASYEVSIIESVAKKHPELSFSVGIRASLDIGQEEASRFGFDVESKVLFKIIERLNAIPNVTVTGLHSHLPYRTLESFEHRMNAIRRILEKLDDYQWDYISIGGGYMGRVDEELAKEFSFIPPTYEQYAYTVASEINSIYKNRINKPKLIIEPGSALVANAMKYVTRVVNIKCNKGMTIATLSGSTFGINPSVKGIKRPIEVFMKDESPEEIYENIDMAGFTCIESDYLYKGYSGKLARGGFVIFQNVGSYSVVMKPPFILPDIPILEINADNDISIVKEAQTEEDVFARFVF